MEQTIEVSLDNKGHIFIPRAILKRLGLTPGMSLVVEDGDDNNIHLHAQPEHPRLIDKDGVLVVSVEPLSDLTGITQRERNRRVISLLERVTS